MGFGEEVKKLCQNICFVRMLIWSAATTITLTCYEEYKVELWNVLYLVDTLKLVQLGQGWYIPVHVDGVQALVSSQ